MDFGEGRQDLDTETGTHAKTDPLRGQPYQATGEQEEVLGGEFGPPTLVNPVLSATHSGASAEGRR